VIHSLLSDSMESNAYVVVADRVCVIDPGINAERVLKRGREYNIRIDVLINTHCHFDHVGANPGILGAGSVEALCHVSDAEALVRGDGSMQLANLFGVEAVMHGVDQRLQEGDAIDLGGVRLEVLHTPGHTPGSISLYEPGSKSLFTGDTVFADGVGRTDFKGGSWDELKESVKRLADFVAEREVERVYPGHGPVGSGEDVARVYDRYF
jgi:hydroxyacylglutathione hydrolase